MSPKQKSPLTLPQSSDHWYCAIRKLRTWVQTEEGSGKYFQPLFMPVVQQETGLILAGDFFQGIPKPEEIQKKLFQVMSKPQKQFQFEPHRPAEIHFEDEALADAMRPLLEEAQIAVRYQPQKENMDRIIKMMQDTVFNDENSLKGMVGHRGVKPEMAAGFYAAALEFYRAAPWVQLSNFDVLAIQVPPRKEPWYVIVMGQAGQEYGLSISQDRDELMDLFRLEDSRNAIPSYGRHMFSYNAPPELSFDDLEAIEQNGWAVPGEELIPTAVLVTPDDVQRPDAAMVRWYEAVLRAIPVFVEQHLETSPDGSHPPVEAEVKAATSRGEVTVHIRYPAVDLAEIKQQTVRHQVILDEEDEEDLESLSHPDMRGMEGAMARLSKDMGAEPIIRDRALDKAQTMMYDAWESPDPKRRIALAKKALKTSPNCADAYVLLAQEEARTHADALKLFEAGVAAGRRALGEDFFQDPENVGYFWGILETRPYMRAMQGLAVTKWELNQREEAVDIFRELLRLNPNDNQGNRDSLLCLLLDLNRNEEARALMKQYQGDFGATWKYDQALLDFREFGDSSQANRSRTQAVQWNKFVPAYLTGQKRLPAVEPEFYSPGQEDEAIIYASSHLKIWRQTPGAVEWLASQAQAKRKK